MHDRKKQDWKMTDKMSGVENARQENDGHENDAQQHRMNAV